MQEPNNAFSSDKPIGLGEQIAEILTNAILVGEFKSGDHLGEHALQARFEVSRSPLREAFRELEKRGLVEIIPRKGAYVKKITKKDIEDNFPIRAALEGLAAEMTATNFSEKIHLQMKTALSNMKDAVKTNNTKKYHSYHQRYHEAFIDHCGNDLLINTLRTLRMQNLWHQFSYQYYQEDLKKSFDFHVEHLNLFNNPKKNLKKIRALTESHINVALHRFLSYAKDEE